MKTENWFPLLPGDDGGSIFPSLPDFCGVRTFMGVVLKWPTVHWRGNWRENLSVQVQWLRAARQECRDLVTVCVPVHAFYITLFLAQVCSDIKGQYKSPFEYAFFWYLMSHTFWKQPLAGSSKQDLPPCGHRLWENPWTALLYVPGETSGWKKRPRTSRLWKHSGD